MSDTTKVDRTTGQPVRKPDVVQDYNKHMGSVDVADFMANSYSEMRRSLKWYKKLVFYLNDVSVTNAYLLFKDLTGSKIRHVDFVLDLVEQLVVSATLEAETRPLPTASGRPLSSDVPERLMYRSSPHWPEPLPATQKKRYPSKPCVVCKPKPLGRRHVQGDRAKRPESRYMCVACDVPLHIYPCFKIYHTQSNYHTPLQTDTDRSSSEGD